MEQKLYIFLLVLEPAWNVQKKEKKVECSQFRFKNPWVRLKPGFVQEHHFTVKRIRGKEV